MKPGDYVRYRDRLPTDPPRTGGPCDGWGEKGIVVRVFTSVFKAVLGPELTAVVWTEIGDFVEARCDDLEILG